MNPNVNTSVWQRLGRAAIAVAIFVLLLASKSQSQVSPWVSQYAGFPPGLASEIRLAAVNENVCWGVKISANTTTNYYMRTTNGGAQWTTSSIGIASSLRGSNIAALDANTAWIAMYDPSGATNGGIFKTTNGGASWVQQTTAFLNAGGVPIFIYFFDANEGVCGGNPNTQNLGGDWEVYRTTNGVTNGPRF